MTTKFSDVSMTLLGLGSLVFGAWGLVDPRGLTEKMGDDPDLGRVLGVRDAVIGIALMARPGPGPVVLRMLSDLHDAVRLKGRQSSVVPAAVAMSAWSALVLVSHSGVLSRRGRAAALPGA